MINIKNLAGNSRICLIPLYNFLHCFVRLPKHFIIGMYQRRSINQGDIDGDVVAITNVIKKAFIFSPRFPHQSFNTVSLKGVVESFF
jgi:hypothetical protein